MPAASTYMASALVHSESDRLQGTHNRRCVLLPNHVVGPRRPQPVSSVSLTPLRLSQHHAFACQAGLAGVS